MQLGCLVALVEPSQGPVLCSVADTGVALSRTRLQALSWESSMAGGSS